MPALFKLGKQAGQAWLDDHASYLAAAVAYHAIFSLVPLLIVLLAIIGLIYGQGGQTEFNSFLQANLGSSSATFIQDMLQGGQLASQSGLALVIGSVLTLVGALGAFGQLEQAVRLLWKTPDTPFSIGGFLGRQFGLFLLVGFTALLLIASLTTSTILAHSSNYIAWLITLSACA